MSRRRSAFGLLQLRWLFDSSLVAATWVTVVLGAWSMARVGNALRFADAVRLESDHELARLAAETAVANVQLDAPEGGVWRSRVGQIDVTVELDDDRLSVESVLPGSGVHSFAAVVLAGAAPPMFGQAESHDVPPLDDEQLARASRAEDLSLFRRESGVALMYFDGGTDLDDFVMADQGGQFDDRIGGVVVVPGHLWVERGDKPLELRCARDVTVVIRGNLYVDRSIQVVGPGRVMFVTIGGETARPFVDRDGNGRCSTAEAHGREIGAIEGGGNVYLGLADSAPLLTVGAGLVAGGYLHLWRGTSVDGPVIAAHPPVRIAPNARLMVTGQRLFHPQRETVPGFAVTGPARSGLLFEVRRRPNSR